MDVPDAPQFAPEELRLTLEQRRIVEALLTLGAAELAQLYLGALLILSRPDLPGAVYFVGHACREVWNALPRYVDTRIPKHVQYVQRLNDIRPLWDEWDPGTWTEGGPAGMPYALYRRLAELVEEHKRAHLTHRERVAAMFRALKRDDAQDGGAHSQAGIDDWLRLGKVSLGLTHLRAQGEGPPLRREAGEALTMLEGVLWRRVVQPAFYEGVEVLDEIVQEANE